ncbi:MAG: tetratricopeptide repeat protein, partial [Candidatus Omnitrophica bacterium]|nr:tetratricopeptide repeat protein [Candidatus Omnitrophota bacterium]
MEFRKQPVSERLERELVRPMTRDADVLRLFGKSFYVKWRSQEEWDIYKEILRRDPDFAEIRFWYANQKYWETKDAALWNEYIRALQSHLVIPALGYVFYDGITDPDLKEKFWQIVEEAERDFPDHPVVASQYVGINNYHLSSSELNKFLSLAQKYPCYEPLLLDLATAYRDRDQYDKSMPLYLSTFYSNYMPGTGRFDDELLNLALLYLRLGYLSESRKCAELGIIDSSLVNRLWLTYCKGLVLQELFWFEQARDPLIEYSLYENNPDAFLQAAMGLFASGDFDKVNEFGETPKFQQMLYIIEPLFEARKALAAHKAVLALSLLDGTLYDNGKDFFFRAEEETIKAEALFLLNRKDDARRHAVQAWYLFPRSRRMAYLLEVILNDDVRVLGRFFEVAVYIFPNDPYWKQKLSSLKKRGYKPEDDDPIALQLLSIKERYNKVSMREKSNFWFTMDPFLIEDLCRRALTFEKEGLKNDALSLYIEFASSSSQSSARLRDHTNAFFKQLLLSLSSRERAAWNRKFEDALDNMSEKVSRDNSLAVSYVKDKRYDKALEIYREVLRIQPDSDIAYNGIGNIYYEKGMYDEAIAMCKKAIEINPRLPEPYINIGNVYLARKMEREAIDEYMKALHADRKAIRKMKGLGKFCFYQGNKYYDENNFDKAAEIFRVAIASRPDAFFPYYNLACTYAKMGDNEKALKYLKMCLELDEKGQAREEARTEKDFIGLKENKEFRKLVYQEQKRPGFDIRY